MMESEGLAAEVLFELSLLLFEDDDIDDEGVFLDFGVECFVGVVSDGVDIRFVRGLFKLETEKGKNLNS